MSQPPDLRKFLDSWAYDPDNNVRLARGADGRVIMVVRQPMGLEQYEIVGRPDGQRPHGMESALEFQLQRLAAAKLAGVKDAFQLTTENCAELFAEGKLFYDRFLNFCHLKDWVRAERDAAHNLRLLDFIRRYAVHEKDYAHLELWRRDLTRMNAGECAMLPVDKGSWDDAFAIARESIGGIEGVDEHLESPGELASALVQRLRDCLASGPARGPREESVFTREGDYWTIIYQDQVARLRATYGLHYLACLLRHPGREFHVSELVARGIEVPSAMANGGQATALSWNPQLHDAGPILDAQAKAEYKRRLEEIRGELEEAERFNDPERAARSHDEMNTIAEQIASAVGLGGRDRRTGSEAERARSAVTRRIKESIKKIADVIPSLGRHLDARIKTGYFCSYNPHPDRLVAWKF